MESKELFAEALELKRPWYIKKVYFKGEGSQKILHIDIGHTKRTKFKYDAEEFPVYDHQERTWRHLNFFQHECHINASVPRVKIKDGSVKLVDVPWALKGSSFSLLFEYDILELIKEGMSATGVGRKYEIGGKTVFRIVRKHTSYALATQEIAVVKELAVDETSSKRGHNYFTIMSDRKAKIVVGVGVGKDKEAFNHALIDMEIRGADRHEVRCVTMDMSISYITSVDECMSQADIVFDRFHIVKKMNEAVDEVRRQDQKEFGELKKSRYLWLKNNSNLKEEQRSKLNILSAACPNIGTAYRLKELLQIVLDNAYSSHLITPLNEWIKEAWSSGLKPIQKFINMLRNHWYGIKGYFERLATNAYAERINLKIQEIKRVAKGYRNVNNFITMIYFHLGGLKLKSTEFG